MRDIDALKKSEYTPGMNITPTPQPSTETTPTDAAESPTPQTTLWARLGWTIAVLSVCLVLAAATGGGKNALMTGISATAVAVAAGAAVYLYFLPTVEAMARGQNNVTQVALVNVFFGWSLLGWVLALVWAVKPQETSHQNPLHPLPPTANTTEQDNRATKDCPMCGETVLAVARKCKHCGSMLDDITQTT